MQSQSLFYWIIYSYFLINIRSISIRRESQSLFYWIIYSYSYEKRSEKWIKTRKSQSLFYWIIYSYQINIEILNEKGSGLNPYFTGLSILILGSVYKNKSIFESLNPYFTGLSILIGKKLLQRIE